MRHRGEGHPTDHLNLVVGHLGPLMEDCKGFRERAKLSLGAEGFLDLNKLNLLRLPGFTSPLDNAARSRDEPSQAVNVFLVVLGNDDNRERLTEEGLDTRLNQGSAFRQLLVMLR